MESLKGERWTSDLGRTLSLAWPIVLGNMSQILISFVDTAMIGQVGVTELGACAFVSSVATIPLIVTMGLLAAVPVLVSQADGVGQRKTLGEHLNHSLLVALGMSGIVVLGLAGNFFFLDHYGQHPDVVAASGGYYILIGFSLAPAFLMHWIKGFSEGLGCSTSPMVALLLSVGLNVFLNWVFIFGRLGGPEMGLVGAGWATLISRTAAFVGFWTYLRLVSSYQAYMPSRWLRGVNWKGVLAVLKLGVPAAAQNLFEVCAFSGAGIIIGWLGPQALASHQIAISWAGLAFMVPLGISIALGIRVGNSYGRGDLDEVRRRSFAGMAVVAIFTAFTAGLFLFWGNELSQAMVDDPITVKMAAEILVVVGVFQIVDGVQVACIGALRGMSDVNVSMLIGFLAYWVTALPLGGFLAIGMGLGPIGMWIGLAIGLGIAAILLVWRLVLMTRGR